VEVQKEKPRAIFSFERTTELDEAVQAFWRSEVVVEPKQWFNAQREIKSRLYSL